MTTPLSAGSPARFSPDALLAAAATIYGAYDDAPLAFRDRLFEDAWDTALALAAAAPESVFGDIEPHAIAEARAEGFRAGNDFDTELHARIAELERENGDMAARLKGQDSTIHGLSAQLAVAKAEPTSRDFQEAAAPHPTVSPLWIHVQISREARRLAAERVRREREAQETKP